MKYFNLAAVLLTGLIVSSSMPAEKPGDKWEKAFLSPPESTKPWVYWYWISDNISKEGITRDLEAMAEVGIGEALIGNVVDYDVPLGNVPVLSEQWWECVEHAVYEAERLGIKVGMFNCPGWSQSGGPWVGPEQSMRYLVTEEFRVTGPVKLRRELSTPGEFFQPVALQAFPAPVADNDILTGSRIDVSATGVSNPEALFDGDPATVAEFNSYPAEIIIRPDSPATIRSLEMVPALMPMTAQCRLEAGDGNGNWQEITSFAIDRGNLDVAVGPMVFGPICRGFEAVTAQEFRLVFTEGRAGCLSGITLSGAPRLNSYVEKQLGKMSPVPEVDADSYKWDASIEPDDPSFTVRPESVTDLMPMLNADGIIEWDVPPGEWVVTFTGMRPTGTKNAPTTDRGRGPEIDKMNSGIAGYHFDSFIGKLLERIPAEKRTGLRHVIADSYEQGSQNWTEGFAEDFERTYGYDPYPWLPVLTGRIVENADRSERFLWDMRRLVADRIATEYVGGLREKCEENGLRLWLENYGHWGFPGEFLNYGGASHDLGGEFWLSMPSLGPVEVRCASSAGHIYGKRVISVEAFTSHWTFNQMPRDLKLRGDWSWCEGMNHFVLHVYIHQPDERMPGMSAWFGTDFNRHSTWFDRSKSYFDYVRRSCALLQSGVPVADVAYFIGEDAPKMTGDMDPALPRGYDYDFINSEVLLRDARVVDGRIVLAGGPSYAVMVLPPQNTMRPETLEKIAALVSEGASVIGPRPERSPSGKGFPKCDYRVDELSSRMWGKADGATVKSNPYGAGKVYCGISLDEFFLEKRLVRDCSLPEGFLYTHRREEGCHLYFVSNQTDEQKTVTAGFRVDGLVPELWDPVTGKIYELPAQSTEGGVTYVDLDFGPADSWFVVFRKKSSSSTASRETPFARYKTHKELAGEWTVTFDPVYGERFERKFTSLVDWTENADPEVKYYSGTATYRMNFEFDGDPGEVCLDLGEVNGLAGVRLNGHQFPVLWRYPYRLDAGNYIRPGDNVIEIEITNCWWNRLVGDRQPGTEPRTWSAFVGWDENSQLLPSGLNGPVRLMKMEH